jgi:nitroreductase
VTDSEIKQELGGLFSRFLKKAPVVIVGCANPQALLTGKWATVDTTIALQNMVLAAWNLGIGSCWIGAFNEQKVKNSLQIPEDWKVVALIALGYLQKSQNQEKRNPQRNYSATTHSN